MKEYLTFIEKIVEKGGPDPEEYADFKNWLNRIATEVKEEKITNSDLQALRNAFGGVLSLETMYGHTFLKPYGYAGDFEIIEKIYQKHTSPNPNFSKWDINYNSTEATVAVRNRKEYLKYLLDSQSQKREILRVLNVASGPARDLLEFFSTGRGENVFVDCVEYDAKAIAYASNLCKDHLTNINFIHSNAFKYKTEKKYDLVWSAGLFDYFDDKSFKYLLGKLLGFLATQGELVIGNFSENNPTRNYMEIIGDWILHHRNREQLIRLAEECNVPQSAISVDQESEGINLFLHIKF